MLLPFLFRAAGRFVLSNWQLMSRIDWIERQSACQSSGFVFLVSCKYL